MISAWLSSKIGNGASTVIWNQNYMDITTETLMQADRILPHSPYDAVVGEVCKICNEGWLNEEVEKPVQTILPELAKGQFANLRNSHLNSLSLWAAKVASIRGLMDKGKRAIPREHYTWMYENREPPPNTFIWMAKCDSPLDTWTRHLRFELETNDSHIKFHATTIVLGNLMFHIVGISDVPSFLDLDDIGSLFADSSSGACFLLWPNPEQNLPHNWRQMSSDEVILTSSLFFDVLNSDSDEPTPKPLP